MNEALFDGLYARFGLCLASGQLYQNSSGTFGLPRWGTSFSVSAPTTFAEAKAAYSDQQPGPLRTYLFECDAPLRIEAGAYWVQILMECLYQSEGRPVFRGVSRRAYDYVRAGSDDPCGRSYKASLPTSIHVAGLLGENDMDHTKFSGLLTNADMGVTMREPSSGTFRDIRYLAVGVMQ